MKPTKKPEPVAALKARYYPSQMNSQPDPSKPFVRAIVGPNRSSSAALSYGYDSR